MGLDQGLALKLGLRKTCVRGGHGYHGMQGPVKEGPFWGPIAPILRTPTCRQCRQVPFAFLVASVAVLLKE